MKIKHSVIMGFVWLIMAGVVLYKDYTIPFYADLIMANIWFAAGHIIDRMHIKDE